MKYDFVIVGAGILGLAHARVLSSQGFTVCVLERDQQATGASIRNFGMVWPIGQPPGVMREMAIRSRQIWSETLKAAGIWHRECGSLHLAYHEDELEVLGEFNSLGNELGYSTEILSVPEVLAKSTPIKEDGLLGALWSPTEISVNPRTVVRCLPAFLESQGVEFKFGVPVTSVRQGAVFTPIGVVEASQILLCTGDAFEYLYPEMYSHSGMVRCRLQMMKARPKHRFEIGTHLCAGLTLGHYSNFRICPGLPKLLERYRLDWPDQVRWGVHLLVSQHEDGTLTIGDSHEYGKLVEPFLREEIDRLILDYLDTFLPVNDLEITERWYGVYAKHPEKSFVIEQPEEGVTIVNGVGGAGMTLSFGLAEHVFNTYFAS